MIPSVNDTLDDIKSNDIDNLDVMLRDAKFRFFPDHRSAFAFIGHAVFSRLRDLGMTVREATDHRRADEWMERNSVRIETRDYEGEDEWRSGTYIYKGGEIVGFVTAPQKNLTIDGYRVRTTINAD